jgi:peptide/nickel transport system substrate-binding protein
VIRALALAAIAFVLAALPAAAQAPQRGGTLTFAVIGDPPTLDCHAANSFAVLHYVSPHYSLLVKFDPAHHPDVIGDAAERWTVAEDGLAYTFTLRPNILFHDGSALTSADVVASFERLRNPPRGVVSARQSMFQNIAAIEAPDARTVVFRLTRPQPYFLGILANPFNCLYSAAKLREDANFPARTVMGTGPFVFVERVPGSHWIGRRFDRYFRAGQPYLDGFRAVNMTPTALTGALQGGQVMAEFRGVPPAIRDRLVQALGQGVAVQESTWALSLVLAFNSEHAPFNDARVRRALNIAIDRWSAAQNLARIVSLRSVGATQRPGSPYAASDAELAQLPGFARDMAAARAEARRLLREAGQERLRFTLTNRNIQDPYVAAGVFLIDQWRQVGVTVEQSLVDAAPWQQAMTAGTFDAMLEFSNELVDDPELELAKYISADRSSTNTARYTDRALDAIYDRLVAARGLDERRNLARAFEARLYEQSYMMPVLWYHRIVVTSSRVQGWRITPSHLLNQDLADVWLTP